jgi:hypothetical protein
LFLAYEAEIEVRLQPGGDLRSISDWSAKLAGATIRIAGVLRLAGDMDDTTTPIDVATIESAIAIAKYFAEHALGAFELMGADPVVADAQHLLEWIKRNELSDFSRRDAHSGNRNRFPKAADLDPPLSLLQDHGWIRRREQGEPSRVGGRPRSPCFDVNPAAPQNSQNAQYPLLLEGFVGSADSVTVPGEESAEWTR